jgi:DNA-binding CsgD family transcriptional regulator
MGHVTSTVIDIVEMGYDMQPEETGWFAGLLEVAEPIFDRGLGASIRIIERPLDGGPIKQGELYTTSNLPPDWNETVLAMYAFLPPELVELRTRPGTAHTYSELWSIHAELRERLGVSGEFQHFVGSPSVEVLQKVAEITKETLIVAATDPQGRGFYIASHLPEATRLTEPERARWQMLGAHLAAGFRLRQGLSDEGTVTSSKLPGRAEAVLDPASFRVTDASGRAKDTGAIGKLREAAIKADRARGRLRKSDPEEALATWWALLQGRWSFVDWFDTDGRRFVLAHPNPPNVSDPRGLTEREAQVVAFAALGETGKLISYRIGMSESTISRELDSAMHKLGVKTQAQLVEKMRGLR